MKKKYVAPDIQQLELKHNIILASGISDDPFIEDGYNLNL